MTAQHDQDRVDVDQELAAQQAWAEAAAAYATELVGRRLTPRQQAIADRATREALRHLRQQERKRGRR
jgi:hypothetical protein